MPMKKFLNILPLHYSTVAVRTITKQEDEAFFQIMSEAGGRDFRIGWGYSPSNGNKPGSHTIALYHSRANGYGDAVYLEVPWQARRAMLDSAGGLSTTLDVTVNKMVKTLTQLMDLNNNTRDKASYSPALSREILDKVNVTYPFNFDLQLPSAAFLVSLQLEPSPAAYLGVSLGIKGDYRDTVDRHFSDELSAIVNSACACTDKPVVKHFRDYAVNCFIPVVRAIQNREFGRQNPVTSPAGSS